MENDKTYEVYMLRNIINNKVYIGSTTIGSGKRFNRHIADAIANKDNYPIHKAIREFGKDNFKLTFLELCDSLEEMNKKEAFYIANYGSTNPEIGYNGKAVGGVRFQSDETKQKIGDIHRGKISDRRKPILQYDGKTGEFIQEFVSLVAASEETGITRGSIIRVLNGKMLRPSNKNPYIWIYKKENELVNSIVDPTNYYSNLEYKPTVSKKFQDCQSKFISKDGNFMSLSKMVAKYDNNGNEIARYDSLTSASKVDGNPSVRTIKTHIEKNLGDWKFIEDNRTEEEKIQAQKIAAVNAARLQGRKIIAYPENKSEEPIIFDTLSDAAKFVGGADRKTLKYHISKEDLWRGYIWEYFD